MGRRRNELRNTAGLILKLRMIVAVQDLKMSFYLQSLVPPHFWLVPFSWFALATALLAACFPFTNLKLRLWS